jgi:hypothetical protein
LFVQPGEHHAQSASQANRSSGNASATALR